MTDEKIAISSLAMDLKRVALGYYNGSENTAARFASEALKRKVEIELFEIKPYLKQALEKLPGVLSQEDKSRLAEDALMYSTIFQNYALKIS